MQRDRLSRVMRPSDAPEAVGGRLPTVAGLHLRPPPPLPPDGPDGQLPDDDLAEALRIAGVLMLMEAKRRERVRYLRRAFDGDVEDARAALAALDRLAPKLTAWQPVSRGG